MQLKDYHGRGELAVLLGVSREALSMWELRRTQPGRAAALQILRLSQMDQDQREEELQARIELILERGEFGTPQPVVSEE